MKNVETELLAAASPHAVESQGVLGLWGALAVFVVAYILIVTEKVNRTTAALLGAMTVVFLQTIPTQVAIETIDINVFFLLVGMMIIVEILSQTGLFEWIAVVIAQRAKGNGLLILIGLTVATAFLSAFLDNVTTVVLIVPITILITQILELPATPFLILEALFSNVGGTATLIGDPPNILIGSKSGLTFNQFFLNLAPVVVICILVLVILMVTGLRKHLDVAPAARAQIMKAKPAKAITDPHRLKRALPVFLLTLLAFCFHHLLHLEPGIVALTGAVLCLLVTGSNVREAFEKVEWDTIFFLFGLFILVGALEHNGLFILLGERLFAATQGHFLLATLAILWVSGVMSAFLGAVPVSISMIPLVQSMLPAFTAQSGAHATPTETMWWALALGCCFGGNGTLLGTTANVVVVQIARKNNYRISFTDFMRFGLPTMFLTLLLASLYLWIRYFVL
jgi:Na+/H+ antiporter NhaD/arsenite permease-like protein